MYRILLVDDEALIREGVSENVSWEKYGYELVGSCENGKEALAFIESNPVDVLLTDICMPYMDGMKLSEKLSVEYPDIKIIILSGYDEFEYAKKAIKYGVKEYLLKPITAQEMGETLLALKEEMDKELAAERNISTMKANYHKGQILLYANVLMDLIMGCKSEEESRRELEEVGINLDSLAYRVGILELDVYARTDKLKEDVKKQSALMAFVLYNITQEFVKKYEAGEVCQGKDHRTFILFHSNKPIELLQNIRQVYNEIILHMNQVMEMEVNAGLGSSVGELKDIYKSYEEAEESLTYHYLLGGNRIFEMEIIREEKKQPNVEGMLEAVLLHLKENASDKIKSDLDKLTQQLKDCRCDRQETGMILQRISDAIEEWRKTSVFEDRTETGETVEILPDVLKAGDLEEAVQILYSYCLKTGESLDSQKNIGGKKYAVLAMDYIEKNYDSCDLSLQTVCSYLNISPSRFSSIFKAATGNTFMDILSGIRMHKAKELLINTDMKNYEIAEKVGFNDPHYFSIAFKKATGKSPTEYAKEMKK